jgi:uncharacterized protein (TIGR02145 family)
MEFYLPGSHGNHPFSLDVNDRARHQKMNKLKNITGLFFKGIALFVAVLVISNSCSKSDDGSTTIQKPGTITDIDGNLYHTVTIGTQVWMVENLQTTRYNNGIDIPYIYDSMQWSNLYTPGYCWYRNDAFTYKNLYGALYNWYAVATGNLAPLGWHVPTNSDWSILIDFLGGTQIAGAKMKDTANWKKPDTGATNESGFTALPGGMRWFQGSFLGLGQCTYLWSNTQSTGYDYYVELVYNSPDAFPGPNSGKEGFSVRCIRDN